MMPRTNCLSYPALVLCLAGASLRAEQTASRTPALTLDPSTKLDVTNAQIQWLDYRGRRALKLAPRTGHERDTDQEMFAVLTDSDFKDGVIEIDVAGARRAGYSTAEDVSGYKGIVGLTFRMQGDRAERFYIRPENSRLSNQLFRNRSTQYESSPDFPWQRLRQENPGVYESYADIESGAWTRLRIEVDGTKARLYVNGAAEPCLIVNDLKNGASSGKIALWARISSEAYFSNLRVTPKQSADSLKFSEVRNGSTEVVDYRGQRAVRLVPSPTTAGHDAYVLAVLAGSEFHDGTIETEIAGTPRPGAPADSRGFIGIAFRVQAHGDQSEIFYLRPTNGRADDQIRRNHSVQYESAPDYPWSRLRQENPGVYESYADLEAGAWTKVKIVVAGTTARLYVNGADQPSLVVNDLKRGDSHGQIALWSHVETDAYFGALHVSRQ